MSAPEEGGGGGGGVGGGCGGLPRPEGGVNGAPRAPVVALREGGGKFVVVGCPALRRKAFTTSLLVFSCLARSASYLAFS
jgi:hypothetical protein